MSQRDYLLLPLSEIRPTEETCPRRVGEVVTMIRACQAWTRPICIEDTVGALLDGHHRFAAAHLLGLARIPVHVFDYSDVVLASWRDEFEPTRAEVLARALSGNLYPRKTTRHAFAVPVIEPIPLSALVERGCETTTVRDSALRSGARIWQATAVEQAEQDRRQG